MTANKNVFSRIRAVCVCLTKDAQYVILSVVVLFRQRCLLEEVIVEEKKKVYVTRQFIEKFSEMFANDDVSFGDIAGLLVFQPFFVAHLLQVANRMCLSRGSSWRPTSVQAIINILGLNRVAEEIEHLEYAPLEEEEKVLGQAINCYILASAYACFAEERFGKKKAQDHFLAGLIAPLIEDNPSIVDECHNEIRDYFNSTYTQGVHMEGTSTLAHIKELIAGFEKGGTRSDVGGLYEAWYTSKRKAHSVLVVYSGSFVK